MKVIISSVLGFGAAEIRLRRSLRRTEGCFSRLVFSKFKQLHGSPSLVIKIRLKKSLELIPS